MCGNFENYKYKKKFGNIYCFELYYLGYHNWPLIRQPCKNLDLNWEVRFNLQG